MTTTSHRFSRTRSATRPTACWPRVYWPSVYWPRVYWPRVYWPRTAFSGWADPAIGPASAISRGSASRLHHPTTPRFNEVASRHVGPGRNDPRL